MVSDARIEFGAKHGGFISWSRFVVSGVDKESAASQGLLRWSVAVATDQNNQSPRLVSSKIINIWYPIFLFDICHWLINSANWQQHFIVFFNMDFVI
jgi:hypothetical protein